jgi:DNA-binding response OmpR family regulator
MTIPAVTPARRAVVVDDEPDLAELVASYLRRDGFAVRLAGDGPAALAVVRDFSPDLVVLDLALPGLDGLEVCRRIRTFSDCYLIMLTARAEEVDTLIGLSVGADDYMTKPFSPREVVARARVLFRRPRTPLPAPAPSLVFKDLVVDTKARRATLRGVAVELTKTEFDILAFLAEHADATHSRDEILSAVWDTEWVGDRRAVDVHVTHIRAKLGAGGAGYVRTVRGVGYQIGHAEPPVAP